MSRLHLVGLPHTETTRQFSWCAYTSKLMRFATMMTARGHEVYLYGGEATDAECKEHVPVVTRAEQGRWFAEYDFDTQVFGTHPHAWEIETPWWTTYNYYAARAIRDRYEPGDIVCLSMGVAHKPIADALPGVRCVEYGIGYTGVFADYRCYESQAWRHYVQGFWREPDGRFFDTVIPNFFDPDDFHLASDKGDYLLFVGRLHPTKGTEIVNDVALRTGRRLLIAGQGDPACCPAGQYLGVVRGEERAELMANAHAVLCPSKYLEPFGGVAVESMLSGTAVITTNWGAYPETVQAGCGSRCDTLAEFIAAVDGEYDPPARIREKTVARYGLEAVAPQYEAWFDRLALLDRPDGWHTLTTDGI